MRNQEHQVDSITPPKVTTKPPWITQLLVIGVDWWIRRWSATCITLPNKPPRHAGMEKIGLVALVPTGASSSPALDNAIPVWNSWWTFSISMCAFPVRQIYLPTTKGTDEKTAFAKFAFFIYTSPTKSWIRKLFHANGINQNLKWTSTPQTLPKASTTSQKKHEKATWTKPLQLQKSSWPSCSIDFLGT